MLTATSILGKPARLREPSDVLRPVDLGALAERVAALAVRASGYKLGVKVEPPVKASGTSAGAQLGWDHRHQWQPAHPEGDPAGLPSGKIKHAVLVVAGKRYRGVSHFAALPGVIKDHGTYWWDNHTALEGFETDSGHFLDRRQAASYVSESDLNKWGKKRQEQLTGQKWLAAQDVSLQAVDGKLYTQDAVQARHFPQAVTESDIREPAQRAHQAAVRKALSVAEATAIANAKEADEAKAKRRREEAAALALLLLGAAGASAYAALLPHLLRVAVQSAPTTPATAPSAPVAGPATPTPLTTLPAPAGAPAPSLAPATPTPDLGYAHPFDIEPPPEPTPEQLTEAAGGKTVEEAAEAYADERAQFLKPFCSDIQEAMRLEVEVGKANGESIHQIAKRLHELAQGVYGSRGAVLAATEAQSAYGHAQLRALAAAGYRKASWVQVERPTKRDSHAENVKASPLKIGDTWPNGQKFPGDPIGGPGECVNCWCLLVGADWHRPKPERVLTRRQKLRRERLAKREAAKASDWTPSEAVKAASPKFGCLMAQFPELAPGVGSIASGIAPEDLAEDGVETEPHATVLYGFNLDFDPQRLREVLDGFGPFEVRLGKLSRFECPEYDVVKFEVHSDQLRALNAKLAEEFKDSITPSKWDYNPHVTVAYVKKGAARGLDGSKLEGQTVEVRNLLYSLPDKQGRVEFGLSSAAKASDPSQGDEVKAVHVKEHESHSATGKVELVREHEDSRTKQAPLPPVSQVGDKAKELAAGVTWTHGGGEAKKPEKFPEGPHVHKSREHGDIEMRDATPEERKKLAIAPAYGVAKVPVNPDSPIAWKAIAPNGKIQLQRSENEAGRKLQLKHERGQAFHKEVPKLRKLWEDQIESKGKNYHEALVLRLVYQTGFRNGGEGGGGKVPAFGASSLRSEHVTVDGDKIHFKFPGKGGHLQEHDLQDATLADHFKARKEAGEDRMFDTDASKVLSYLHLIDGKFIVHDFRTYAATRTAADIVSDAIKNGIPKTVKEAKAVMKEALEKAARKIGDTVSVAKKSYVNPQVFAVLGL